MSLFSEIKFGKFLLKNRIALAPMTRSRATDDFVPTPEMTTYYTQRADALLITEATGISPQGLGWFHAPGIWSEKQIAEWKKVTESVHSKNGVIGCQLWHMGRQAHTDVTGQPRIVSSSPIALTGDVTVKPVKKPDGTWEKKKKPNQVPFPLLNNEAKSGHEDEMKDLGDYKATIEDVVKDYGKATKNALSAGFDFVEIHAANGYLIDQFLQSSSNKRKDKYGGSLENRLLFMKEVVNEVCKSVGGANELVGIRLSPNGAYGEMGSADNVETFKAAIGWLSKVKPALGYIHILDGLEFGFHKMCDPFTLKMARDVIVGNGNKETLLMGNAGYTKEKAEERIKSGDGDLIAFGRPFISNPDLVSRFQKGLELNPDAAYEFWFQPHYGAKGYSDWPTAEEKSS